MTLDLAPERIQATVPLVPSFEARWSFAEFAKGQGLSRGRLARGRTLLSDLRHW